MRATYTQHTDKLVRQWHAEGITITEQARRLGVDRSTVETWRHRLGLVPDSQPVSPELHRKILEWGGDGWPLREIAETSGLSLRQVRRQYPQFRMDAVSQGMLGGAVRRAKRSDPRVMQGL